jgi:hypothetical protein
MLSQKNPMYLREHVFFSFEYLLGYVFGGMLNLPSLPVLHQIKSVEMQASKFIFPYSPRMLIGLSHSTFFTKKGKILYCIPERI